MMNVFIDFINLFYSFPLFIYSIPFSIMLFLLLLSVFFGLVDFDIDIDSFSSIEGVFSHFQMTKVPINLVLFIFFLITSVISFIFMYYINDNKLILSLFMLFIAYPSLHITAYFLRLLAPLFIIEKQDYDYIGKKVKIHSLNVTTTDGEGFVDFNNSNIAVTIYIDDDDNTNDYKYGDECFIVYFNKKENKYLIKKDIY